MKKPSRDPNTVILNYLSLAHSDHIAARSLLRNGFLEHGAMLGATAVEKYLKAVIGIHGVDNNEHLGGTLYKLLEKHRPDLSKAIDRDLLKFFAKAYRLRYALTSSPGLAIVINQYRTLVALDCLVALIDKGFVLRIGEATIATPHQQAASANDERLTIENVGIDASLYALVLEKQNKVLELKIEDNYSNLRVEYQTEGVSTSGSIMKIPELSLEKNSFTLTRG